MRVYARRTPRLSRLNTSITWSRWSFCGGFPTAKRTRLSRVPSPPTRVGFLHVDVDPHAAFRLVKEPQDPGHAFRRGEADVPGVVAPQQAQQILPGRRRDRGEKVRREVKMPRRIRPGMPGSPDAEISDSAFRSNSYRWNSSLLSAPGTFEYEWAISA